MSFGSDLDYEGFSRAFADHRVRPLLGLSVPDEAAAIIAADDGLLRNVFAEWRRTQADTASETPAPSFSVAAQALPHTPPHSTTAVRAQQPPKDREVADGESEVAPSSTGFWAVIGAAFSLLASWVAMAIGFFLADDRRVPRGEFGFLRYGKESFLVAGDGLVWAAIFTAVALALAIVGVIRGGYARRKFAFIGGIVEIVVVVLMTVIIIFNAVYISTWQ